VHFQGTIALLASMAEYTSRVSAMNARGRGAHLPLAVSVLSLAIALALTFSPYVGVAFADRSPADGPATLASSARQARQFWTPARMRRAKPIEIKPVRQPGVGSVPVTSGESGTSRRVSPSAPRSGASVSSAFGEVSDPTGAESRQNGVIFFRVDGSLGRCSGTSVTAPNFSVVFTAGHCVNSGGPGGRWYRGQWVFVPGYRYGQRPFGVFPAVWLDTTRQWIASGSENFDVGAAVVARNEGGERLAAAVGGAGIAWGLKADQTFDVHGYPVAPPFDGETQRLCAQTPFLGHDSQSFLTPGPLNLAVDCDVTGGASGGGWTIRGDVLNGVTNYGYGDDPATDFGAYFGREVGRLYERAGSVG
jgi:V8-like Glu-specific endopeptidase